MGFLSLDKKWGYQHNLAPCVSRCNASCNLPGPAIHKQDISSTIMRPDLTKQYKWKLY